ncbi:hypothetical protein FGO68_gene13918 [Halteria grandinella]|uniref:Uncharacterized protein n=1 Tax=Halteria grandinella TaxID=5974 RepID=A0A8J8NEU1_HALGN|nr:hypothetical protein FGO68_gene13918 [Halteria grandinella]
MSTPEFASFFSSCSLKLLQVGSMLLLGFLEISSPYLRDSWVKESFLISLPAEGQFQRTDLGEVFFEEPPS